ncbi:MAG: cell division protein FtsW [Chlamydiales bacterium]|jgi:cell division protein FtsW
MQRYLLLICVTLIFGLGLVMVFDTSSADILDRSLSKSTHHSVIRQVLYGLIGCFSGGVASFIGYRNLLKLSLPILCILCFLLLLVFIPGIGKTINGARRWVGIASYTMQPSEFVKFAVPLFYIHYFMKIKEGELDLESFIKLVGPLLVPLVLIFLEPDTGTSVIILLTIFMLVVLTGVNRKFWVLPMVVAVVVGGSLAYNMPYIRARVAVFLNPELDRLGKGHQPYQAKIAAGSGGLTGKGIGKSLQKLNYLPEAQNDYIGAIFAEEFGFLGVLFLIFLYMILAYLGFHIAFSAVDKEGFYLAGSITYLICIQAFLNLGVVSGLLPSTGLNLPLFSQGGTSLMANIIGISILLNIAVVSEKSKNRVYRRAINKGILS